jgi:CRISPR-associated protein Cmr3
MKSLALELKAVDAWFFRDGRPYNEHESNQTDVASMFPPSGCTVLGALRAAWARLGGWDPATCRRWNAECSRFLGSGFNDLGCLALHGPFLMLRRGNAHDASTHELLFPMPLHLLGGAQTQPDSNEPAWTPCTFLWPGPEVTCDLGSARLPRAEPAADDAKVIARSEDAVGIWVTARGLARVTAGGKPDPDDVFSQTQLWKLEARVGLIRDRVNRTTGERALYSPQFVRPCQNVSLAVRVDLDTDDDLPDWLALVPEVFPFGGEGRLALCERLPAVGPPPIPDTVRESILRTGRVTVNLLTPLALCQAGDIELRHPKPGESLADLKGARIISACVGKTIRVGGWDSLTHGPRPLTPLLPAGSLWFCDVREPDREAVLQRHGKHIGEQTRYGFGQIALGTWNDIGGAA